MTHNSRTFTRTIFSLSTIFCFRMLGLFIILPIFALYTHQLEGATSSLMGIAIGAYGLTQAIFQIPLAMASDKIGRKPIIALGLSIFIAGSILAALSTSIYGVIIGRALQGAGAVGSTIIALVADLTTVENRTKAMAFIGMTIGLSFALAMVLGPALNNWIGLSGIFWTTAALGIFGIASLYMFVPHPPRLIFHRDIETLPALFKSVIKNSELLKLNIGILILHALLTASFIAIPFMLLQLGGVAKNHSWVIYLLVLVIAFCIVVPCIAYIEKHHNIKSLFLSAILILGIGQCLLWGLHPSLLHVSISLCIFFTAFTFLEATLPSLISKIAPAECKGTAVGVYSSFQFFGIFLGGSLGGWVYTYYHLEGIFIFTSILIGIWLLAAITMKEPPHLKTLMIAINKISDKEALELSRELKKIKGVVEAAVMANEGIAYMKIDRATFGEEDFQQCKNIIKNY